MLTGLYIFLISSSVSCLNHSTTFVLLQNLLRKTEFMLRLLRISLTGCIRLCSGYSEHRNHHPGHRTQVEGSIQNIPAYSVLDSKQLKGSL